MGWNWVIILAVFAFKLRLSGAILNLNQIKYIDCIRRYGSISSASRVLDVSQQALSKSVLSFEDEFGVQLFRRKKNGMTPTEEGLQIFEAMERVLEEIDALVGVAKRVKGGAPYLNIKVGILSGLLGGQKSPIPIDELLEFSRRQPQVDFVIEDLPNEKIIEGIRSGELDVGLIAGPLPEGCFGHPVCSSSLKAVVSKQYPVETLNRGLLSWRNLCNKKFVLAPGDMHAQESVAVQCRKEGFEPIFLPQFSQFEANVSLAKHGEIVFLCHDADRIRAIDEENVIVLPFDPQVSVDFSLSFIWSNGRVFLEEYFPLEEFLGRHLR